MRTTWGSSASSAACWGHARDRVCCEAEPRTLANGMDFAISRQAVGNVRQRRNPCVGFTCAAPSRTLPLCHCLTSAGAGGHGLTTGASDNGSAIVAEFRAPWRLFLRKVHLVGAIPTARGTQAVPKFPGPSSAEANAPAAIPFKNASACRSSAAGLFGLRAHVDHIGVRNSSPSRKPGPAVSVG
jgi:hypothetical protein